MFVNVRRRRHKEKSVFRSTWEDEASLKILSEVDKQLRYLLFGEHLLMNITTED